MNTRTYAASGKMSALAVLERQNLNFDLTARNELCTSGTFTTVSESLFHLGSAQSSFRPHASTALRVPSANLHTPEKPSSVSIHSDSLHSSRSCQANTSAFPHKAMLLRKSQLTFLSINRHVSPPDSLLWYKTFQLKSDLWWRLTTFSKPSASSRSREARRPYSVWLMGVYCVLPDSFVFSWSSQS